MRRIFVLGLAHALLLAACGGGGGSASGKPAETGGSSESASSSSASATQGECGDNGLYAIPPPGGDGKNHEAVAPAVAAFSDAESAFGKGDKAGASKKFLDAARELSRVPQNHPQGDWARYARELSYHNALWAAAAAGEIEKTKAQLEKASREDSALADKIKAMLVDAPAQCEKE